ncbi:hypothetical protein IWZ01DRAFT_111475 [Phyllosticta capitalensis]
MGAICTFQEVPKLMNSPWPHYDDGALKNFIPITISGVIALIADHAQKTRNKLFIHFQPLYIYIHGQIRAVLVGAFHQPLPVGSRRCCPGTGPSLVHWRLPKNCRRPTQEPTRTGQTTTPIRLLHPQKPTSPRSKAVALGTMRIQTCCWSSTAEAFATETLRHALGAPKTRDGPYGRCMASYWELTHELWLSCSWAFPSERFFRSVSYTFLCSFNAQVILLVVNGTLPRRFFDNTRPGASRFLALAREETDTAPDTVIATPRRSNHLGGADCPRKSTHHRHSAFH